MKKLTIITLLVLCTSVVALAQNESGNFKFSVGPEIGYTAGPFAQSWSLGAGGSAQAEFFCTDHASITLMGGFIGYLGASVPGQPQYKYHPFNTIPVKAGIRLYLGESFHIGAQAGVGFLDDGANRTTAFAYSPIIGYNFKTGNDNAIDFSIKYDGYSFNKKDIPTGYGNTFGAVGLRIAYVF
ncbi:MAG TPA: outer membrane beta-barrel protein [Ferruginibacter sp.]|nr:outer membrane beta-barrel protein [Ferruginibacter sp.]